MGEGDAAAPHGRPHGSRPLKGTKVPEKLVEWGMDQALWDWVKNKQSLAQYMDRGEEQKARWRIARLREIRAEPDDLPAADQLVQQAVQEERQKAALDEKEDDDEEEEEAVDEMRGGITDGAAPPAPGAEEASAGQYFEVTCPEGLLADRMLRIELPDGGEVDVRVPDGTVPGEAFLVGPF